MKRMSIFALSGLMLSSLIQAEVINNGFSNYSSIAVSQQSPYQLTNVGVDVAGPEANAANTSLESTDASVPLYGTKFTVQGNGEHKKVEAGASVDWTPPTVSGFSISEFDVSAWGATRYEEKREEGGLIRFTLDYDIRSAGPNSSASVSFSSFSSWVGELNQPLAGVATFDRLVENGDADAGSWTSDWIRFGSTDELAEIGSFLNSFHYVFQARTGLVSDDLDLTQAGHADAYARAALSWEIAPVPEPETYAMMGLGVMALAVARQRRKKD